MKPQTLKHRRGTQRFLALFRFESAVISCFIGWQKRIDEIGKKCNFYIFSEIYGILCINDS